MGRYEIKLTGANWHTTGRPRKDGCFWCIVGYGNVKSLTEINYTEKYGWNTSKHSDGTYNHEHAFDNNGYISAWADNQPFEVVWHET